MITLSLMNSALLGGVTAHTGELIVYWGPRALVALLIFLGGWLLARFSDRAIARVTTYGRLNVLVLVPNSVLFTNPIVVVKK